PWRCFFSLDALMVYQSSQFLVFHIDGTKAHPPGADVPNGDIIARCVKPCKEKIEFQPDSTENSQTGHKTDKFLCLNEKRKIKNGRSSALPQNWSKPPPWPCRPIKNLHVNAGGSLPRRFSASNVQTPPERAGRPAIRGTSSASRIKDVGFKRV